jgi:hypothetical protein
MSPAVCCAARCASRAVSAMESLIAAMPGGQGCPPRSGTGAVPGAGLGLVPAEGVLQDRVHGEVFPF